MTTYIILALIAVIASLAMVVSLLSSRNKTMREERNRAIGERDGLKRSVDALNQRINDLKAIGAYQKQEEGKIDEAKTDEDVHNVVDGILAGNNARVPDSPK